jgi:hypothetical protein
MTIQMLTVSKTSSQHKLEPMIALPRTMPWLYRRWVRACTRMTMAAPAVFQSVIPALAGIQ